MGSLEPFGAVTSTVSQPESSKSGSAQSNLFVTGSTGESPTRNFHGPFSATRLSPSRTCVAAFAPAADVDADVFSALSRAEATQPATKQSKMSREVRGRSQRSSSVLGSMTGNITSRQHTAISKSFSTPLSANDSEPLREWSPTPCARSSHRQLRRELSRSQTWHLRAETLRCRREALSRTCPV